MEQRRSPAIGDDMMELAVPEEKFRSAPHDGEAGERPLRPEGQRHRHVTFHEPPGRPLRIGLFPKIDEVDLAAEAVEHHLARPIFGIEHDCSKGGGAVRDMPDRLGHPVGVDRSRDRTKAPMLKSGLSAFSFCST